MRRSLFEPTAEGEARLLLLIDTFTIGNAGLDGRTKLAKLDFFLRYPRYLDRALQIRGRTADLSDIPETGPIENRMVRYRYGPWDPSYYAILGRLHGKALVEGVPGRRGLTYRTTARGAQVAASLRETEEWAGVSTGCRLLKRHMDLGGTALKAFIYDHFPEVSGAKWGDAL
jgi:hypothetical protein